MLNLISDPFLRVIRADGSRETIAFHQITADLPHNPAVNLCDSRPDFEAAVLQLGVGLLQTALMPGGQNDWEALLEEPPEPDHLQAALAPYAHAFQLYGSGPRFMQDFQMRDEDGVSMGIGSLLIDAPGGNTLTLNKDFFVKRGREDQLCGVCAATALYCLQCQAPSGGVGHRVSLRGGGPLSTILQGETLWQTLWLNVLTRNRFFTPFERDLNWPQRTAAEDLFPWCAPAVTSETRSDKSFRQCMPEHQHPLHVYWAAPRRIRLLPPQPGSCSICGEAGSCFEGYVTKNYGASYNSRWQHPLTPYYSKTEGELLARLGQPGSMSYRNWPQLLMLPSTPGGPGKTAHFPARVVAAFSDDRRYEILNEINGKDCDPAGPNPPRVRVFGYDMDNMKARAWLDGTMPLIAVPSHGDELAELSLQMADAAVYVAQTLVSAYKKAFSRSPKHMRGDVGFVKAQFFSATETVFYKILIQLTQHCEDLGEVAATEAAKENWVQHLRGSALRLFDQLTTARPPGDTNPRDFAVARNELRNFTSLYSKNLRKCLALPKLTKKSRQPAQ